MPWRPWKDIPGSKQSAALGDPRKMCIRDRGVGLWNQQLPLYNSAPIIASGPDGAIYFAGNIYNTQMINGTAVGTMNSYEVVWGKLSQ